VKAAILDEVGGAFRVDDVELDAPGPGRVHVAVAASGVCRSDLSVVKGIMPQPLPSVLGHEGAGVVVAVGDGVSRVTAGDHVVLSWVDACRHCFFCLDGHVELCEHGIDHAFGPAYGRLRGGGSPVYAGFGTATFGEQTVVPESCCVPIDPSFPLVLAALIGCGVVTGVGSVLHGARVAAGETVAVVGCGGVGLAAIQAARLAGASRIVAVDRLASKLAMATDSGATDVVDAAAGDPVEQVRAITGGRGVDHALEVVGLSSTIRQAYAMARRGGTVAVVGAGGFDDMVQFSTMELMVDAKTVRGVVYGATDPHRDFPKMVELHQRGLLDLSLLVTREIALEELPAAFDAMEAGEVARSVIVY
jgi:S-(hydroxymethyl)glutathione dehydrogenase/alcohol dehydrogenase